MQSFGRKIKLNLFSKLMISQLEHDQIELKNRKSIQNYIQH